MLLYALLFSNTCLAPVRWTSPEERQQVKEILKNSGVLDRSDRSGWPSVRVHHTYPTVEARACDLPTRKKECLMLAALMQAYARASFRTNGDAMGRRHALIGNRRQALLENARNPHDRVIQENHFSVRRFGIHGRMVDYATGENISETCQ
jgi:carboxylate-amine ligase